MQPIVTRTRQNEGGGGDLNATQSYNGKWCHPLPCWLWDHTGWRKIIEHLVLQALTPIVHHCARGHVIAVQPAGGGDTGWEGQSCGQCHPGDPNKPARFLSSSVIERHSRSPSGAWLQWSLLSGCKFERGRVQCVAFLAQKHTHACRGATKCYEIPLSLTASLI